MRCWIPVFLIAACVNCPAVTPTFNRDVAPILYDNCSNCHRPGEVAPFALLNYEDAAKRAKQIAAITQARYMPPWKAVAGYGHFKNERRLTDREIAILGEWAKQGAPEGDPSEKRVPPKFASGWRSGKPDQAISMSEPYALPAEGPDQFRCFAIPLGATEDEYVKTVEFRAGNPRIVHHAIFFLDNSGNAAKKETVPGQGYDCVGGPGLDVTGALGGWAPGAAPSTLPPDVAHEIKKGSDLIMQIHYHPDGKPESDQSWVGLTFAKAPPTRGLSTLILGSFQIDIPPGEDHYTIKASAFMPLDGESIGIFPHAHYLCKDMKVNATLPDGTVQRLIWIDDWDFNWQGAYEYANPVTLPKGTRIDMQYTYDNSAANPHNPSNPPKEVKYGEQTTSEMGFAFLQVTLDSPEQAREFQRGARAELVASMLEDGINTEALGKERSARLQMLLAFFDKNHNGKIDGAERPALVKFLMSQGQTAPKASTEQPAK